MAFITITHRQTCHPYLQYTRDRVSKGARCVFVWKGLIKIFFHQSLTEVRLRSLFWGQCYYNGVFRKETKISSKRQIDEIFDFFRQILVTLAPNFRRFHEIFRVSFFSFLLPSQVFSRKIWLPELPDWTNVSKISLCLTFSRIFWQISNFLNLVTLYSAKQFQSDHYQRLFHMITKRM